MQIRSCVRTFKQKCETAEKHFLTHPRPLSARPLRSRPPPDFNSHRIFFLPLPLLVVLLVVGTGIFIFRDSEVV